MSIVYTNLYTVYRVSWLRARARYLRWEEEVRLVKLEMQWTVNWFRSCEASWKERLQELEDEERDDGLKCYCYKQMGLWRIFGDDAEIRFGTIYGTSSSS